MAALERAQTIVNLEWKLGKEKRKTYLEYIKKNFSPKIVYYDDDPTNVPGEDSDLKLMTHQISEQVNIVVFPSVCPHLSFYDHGSCVKNVSIPKLPPALAFTLFDFLSTGEELGYSVSESKKGQRQGEKLSQYAYQGIR